MKMDIPPNENNKKESQVDRGPLLKRVLMAGLAGLTMATSSEAQSIEKGKEASPSDIAKITSIKANINDKFEKESPFQLWTEGKTKAGETTPTGLNNSFLNNEYGIKPSDIGVVAKHFGFDISSPGGFQKDMFNLLEEKHPDLIKKVVDKYGLPAKGTLYDNLLGVRGAYAIHLLKNEITKEEISVTKTTKEEKETPQIKIEKEEGVLDTKNFDELYVFFDKSPSMDEYGKKDKLAKWLLKATELKIPTHVVGFTNIADAVIKTDSLEKGIEIVKNMKAIDKPGQSGDTKELGMDVLADKFQEKKDKKKTISLMVSDELLQEVTREKLQNIDSLSKDKNVEPTFFLLLEGKEFFLSLGDIKTAFEDKWKQDRRDERIKEAHIRSNQLGKYLTEREEELKTATQGALIKKLKKDIQDTKDLIGIVDENTKELTQLNLGYEDFVKIENQKKLKQTNSNRPNSSNTVVYPGSFPPGNK